MKRQALIETVIKPSVKFVGKSSREETAVSAEYLEDGRQIEIQDVPVWTTTNEDGSSISRATQQIYVIYDNGVEVEAFVGKNQSKNYEAPAVVEEPIK